MVKTYLESGVSVTPPTVQTCKQMHLHRLVPVLSLSRPTFLAIKPLVFSNWTSVNRLSSTPLIQNQTRFTVVLIKSFIRGTDPVLQTPPSLNQMHPVTQAIWTVVLIASGEHDRHPTHQWANLPDDEKADGTDVFKRKQ
ncbi:hypothetical protein WG66_009342 [Moniliophthora roreri]|nr:hypothetical protein WG66_009342 [Moniliophthora roreri]